VLTMNTRAVRDWLVLIAVLVVGAAPASHCQTSFQAWPELDLTWKMPHGWALFVPISFNGKRETDNREATAGASMERRHTRIVSYAVGYRYVWSLANESPYSENRYLAELTTHAHPGGGMSFNDRNRYEYRAINGETSWRYRNRLRVERPIDRSGNSVSSVTPFGSMEVFYDSRYDFFNRVRVELGAVTKLSSRFDIDSYLAFQSDNQNDPPKRVLALGVKLQFTF
jgi:hypothetical protein